MDRTAELRAEDGDFWNRWSVHYDQLRIDSGYVSDGIADPGAFAREGTRVLFVLREPNQWTDTDLRGQLRKGAQYRVWHNVARWAAGLLDGFLPFSDIDTSSVKNQALKRVAVINLKKAPGGGKSSPAQVGRFAFQDRDLLREQLRMIAPDVIVACGWEVHLSLLWLISDERRPPEAGNPLLIPWKHPAARGKKDVLYYQLEERISNARDP